MTKSRIYFYLSFALLVLFLPAGAFASAVISEVMYDLEGTDTDREWIEIVNNGSSAVDVSSFKLFEANTNHALTSVQGSTVLAPGETAIIAVSPAAFLADWPGFSGRLFDSSFSLSNSGETLGIKNGADGEEDSIPYASAMGAQGDGKSLGRSGGTFVPQTPSPGSAEQASQTSSQSSGSLPLANQNTSGSAAPARSISIHAGSNRTVVVGADTHFNAEVYGIEGHLAPDARIIWIFGNGDTREGRLVKYAYPYPGRYLVSVAGALGEYAAESRFVVEAKPAQVALEAETDGALSVLQLGAGDLDISLWQVERAGAVFRFPARTVILAGEGIRLHPQTSGLPTTGPARLLYPNGEEVVRGEAALERFSVSANRSDQPEIYAPLFVVPPEDKPSTEIADVYRAAPAAAAYAVEGSSSTDSRSLLWFLAVLSVCALGASLVVFVRRGHFGEAEVSPTKAADREAEEYRLL